MKFVWLLCGGGGAVPPQLAFCEALIREGHEVVAVLGDRRARQAEASDMRVETFQMPVPPLGASLVEIEQWAFAEGFLGATFAEALRDAIDRNEPDRLLVDGMCYSAQVEARASGIPYAALWHCLVDAAETSLKGLDHRANLSSHNAHRRERGLGEVASVQDTLLDANWFLTFAYEVIDSPRQRDWPNLSYVGAAMPRTPHVDIEVPVGDQPLVLVGLSTIPVGQAGVLQRVLDALATLDVRVLVTLGGVSRDDLDVPANATATKFVPHDQVMPDAALVVSHGGHGTMSASARHGVPILALPMGNDQYRNAQILSDIGIGSWLPPLSTSSEIADLAERLIGDDAIRRRCAEVASAISAHAGIDHAIRLVTEPLG